MGEAWEELQDTGEEEIVRLDVLRIKCDEVKVRQCILRQLQRLIEKLRETRRGCLATRELC